MKRILLLLWMFFSVCSCVDIDAIKNSITMTKIILVNEADTNFVEIGFRNISSQTIEEIIFEVFFENSQQQRIVSALKTCSASGNFFPNEEYTLRWICPQDTHVANRVKIEKINLRYSDDSHLQIEGMYLYSYIL